VDQHHLVVVVVVVENDCIVAVELVEILHHLHEGQIAAVAANPHRHDVVDDNSHVVDRHVAAVDVDDAVGDNYFDHCLVVCEIDDLDVVAAAARPHDDAVADDDVGSYSEEEEAVEEHSSLVAVVVQYVEVVDQDEYYCLHHHLSVLE
jgi:hypothetical protein